jgi:hypothetical protein
MPTLGGKMKSNKHKYFLVAVLCVVLIISVFGCKKKSEDVAAANEEAVEEATKEKSTKETTAEREEPEDAELSPDEGKFVISTSPKDGQFIRGLERPIFVSFSREVTEENFSYSVNPDPGGWSVAWKKGRHVVLSHANPFEPGVSYEMEVAVESEDAKMSVRFTAYGSSSLERIDKDEENGVLDLDTAWTYRLQRLYEPSKLPEKYQSPTPVKCGTWLVKKFQNIKTELNPETIQAMRPYFVRPSHPESVFTRSVKELKAATTATKVSTFASISLPQEGDRPTDILIDPNWDGFESTKFPITVWTTLGREAAKEAISLIDDENMWSEFEGLLGVTPPSDLNEKNEDGSANNGIDGDLDIYLVPASPYMVDTSDQGREDVFGWCISTRDSKKTPTYILVDQSLSGDDLCATLAHELFHSFQAAIDFNERDWWIEGTAVWAEDVINEFGNTEQEYLAEAFISEDNLLETITSEEGDHAYGIYIFPFYLSSRHGDKMIGSMWKSCESKDDIEAIDDVLNGKFDEVFKKFVLVNFFDNAPYVESYDEILGTYIHHMDHEIHLDSNNQPEPQVFEIPPLSAKYISVNNSDQFDPEKTPLVRFDLSPLKANDLITVQAIIDPWEENAKVEDWSDLDEREFCLNIDEEKFDQIVLVIASSHRVFLQPAPLLIDLERLGCGEGEAVATIDVRLNTFEDRDNTLKTGAKIDSTKGQEEVRVRVRMEFELEDEDYDEDTNKITESWLLNSWRIVSSDVRNISDKHYRVEDQYGLYSEIKRHSEGQGKAQKSSFLPGGEGNMQIVFDGDTQKAKTVVFPLINVMLTGETEWSKESTSRSGGVGNWYYRTTTDNGTSELSDMLPIWHVMWSEPFGVSGIQVTTGDGERTFGGRGEHEEKDEHERKVYRSEWNVKRYKKKKKKEG